MLELEQTLDFVAVLDHLIEGLSRMRRQVMEIGPELFQLPGLHIPHHDGASGQLSLRQNRAFLRPVSDQKR